MPGRLSSGRLAGERPLGEGNKHVAVQHKEVCPGILHGVLAEVVDEEGDVGGLGILVIGRDGQRVTAFVVKEHLKTPTEYEFESAMLSGVATGVREMLQTCRRSRARGHTTKPNVGYRGKVT